VNKLPPPDDEEMRGVLARTDLAWSRSGLALAVAAAAILKVVVHISNRRAEAAVLVGILAVATVWLFAMAHARTIARPSIEGHPLNSQPRLKIATFTAIAFAVFALVIVYLPRV
jgi:uncharacterized membrane protein YidH (DUF202 family)